MKHISQEKAMHIVLADDDEEEYEIFKAVMEDLTVFTRLRYARNGDALMQLLHEEVPDLLFLDIRMPCKDGKQCIREIRSNKAYDHLPVIVYSSFDDLPSINFFYRQGANLYVVKPDTIGSLRNILERILQHDWSEQFPTSSDWH